MIFARTAYEDVPEWGVSEEKYIRLIDGAPYEAWSYLGTEVRKAHARLYTPVTGHLFCVRVQGGIQKAPTRKAAARVPAPNGTIPCPREGMDCLYGIAAMIGKPASRLTAAQAESCICGYAAFGGGAVGAYLCAAVPTDSKLTVQVNGQLRCEESVAVLQDALWRAVAHASETVALQPGDMVTAALPAGLLCPGDTLAVTLADLQPLLSTAVRRAHG